MNDLNQSIEFYEGVLNVRDQIKNKPDWAREKLAKICVRLSENEGEALPFTQARFLIATINRLHQRIGEAQQVLRP